MSVGGGEGFPAGPVRPEGTPAPWPGASAQRAGSPWPGHPEQQPAAPRWPGSPKREAIEAPPPPLSGSDRVGGIVLALVQGVASLILGFLSVFALSPTTCPERGGSYLCQNPSLQGTMVTVVLLLLAGGFVTSLVGCSANTGRRMWKLIGVGSAMVVLALVIVVHGGTSWS